MLEIRLQGEEDAKRVIHELIDAAFKHKADTQGWGRFGVEIEFKNGQAKVLTTTDLATHRFNTPDSAR